MTTSKGEKKSGQFKDGKRVREPDFGAESSIAI